jgi:transposase
MEVTEAGLAQVFATVLPLLDERQRRVLVGAQAQSLGRGGIAAVTRASKMSRTTVSKAAGEVRDGVASEARVRREGAGRKRLIDTDPHLLANLDDLVEPASRGDPMCPLRWTAKSTGNLADALSEQGHTVSADTVGRLLKAMGYSLQATRKTREGRDHPDRDAQFVYLSRQVGEHLAAGQPVISVDAKKKLLVGRKANNGRDWQPKGSPVEVDTHDFPDPEIGKAIPYGVYDLAANQAWVSVGDDHDTSSFAVATIRRWWQTMGATRYPGATRLLITADAGGSNSYRTRLWKVELAQLAEQTGMTITVCHFPPGTSKWNRIEHRLFSAISSNWRGRPLESHQVVVNLIGATTTRTGLEVHAELDEGHYPLGVKISKTQMAQLPVTAHDFHGEWNYTLAPKPPPPG